jgi:uncharacterized FlaG/YvyC family protein
MNVSPSDTDVGQGYSLPGSEAISQASAISQIDTAGQDADVNQGSSTSVANQSTASGETSTVDARSMAAQSGADKTTAKETAQKLAQQFQETDTGLTIRVLDDSQHTIQVEVVDKKSNKVLRQIPQDTMLKLSASIKQMTGVLLDKPA